MPSIGLFGIALAFSAGVGLLHLLPTLPPRWPLVTLFLLALLGALRWRRVALAAAFAFGLLWAQADACDVLCQPFPEAYMGRSLSAEGRIAGLPGRRDDRVRFLFRVERLTADGAVVPFRGLVRLNWYRDAPDLRAGQQWRLVVRLKSPHGFANPGGFDYERWLFQQGIAATGHVRAGDGAVLLGQGPGRDWLARWRQQVRDRLEAAAAANGADSAGLALVQALVIGERGDLTPAQWEVFSRTGTSHLIAISGLHVGLVAGFAFFLGRWLWSRSERLGRALAAPRAAALAALLVALGYAALAGFAISTQRAVVMLAVVLLAVVARRTLRPAGGLVLALAAVLLLDPSSVLSYGFWLSFGAVTVLLYALGRRLPPKRPPKRPPNQVSEQPAEQLVMRWGRAQWAVALGLLPLLLLLFGRASLVAPLVNLVAVPLFGVLLPVVLVGTLSTLLTGWGLPLGLLVLLLEQGYALLARVSDWPLASLSLGGRAAWVWVSAFAGVLLLLAPRGLPARWLGVILLAPLLLVRPPAPAPGAAQLTMLDVGQGLAVVVRTARHALVFDLGPSYRSGFETGSAVVLPYLRERGVRRLDLLMISHSDRDHSGGLAGLAGKIPVGRLLSGQPEELTGLGLAGALVGKPMGDLEPAPCLRGQRWQWDGVAFEVLHPAPIDGDAPRHDNDASCVLRIVSAGGASALLTGDITGGVELDLVDTLGAGLRSQLLVAAHHGSATSSTVPFLAAVAPDWVLYSAGYGNRFGFPAAEVRARVDAIGARSVNTADAGAVSFVLPASGEIPPPVRWRDQSPRIWRHRP
ncbi:DNA internalization-related competence protein ComEC/Rec2 [Thiohalocapsa marina]|uniref:DNA internalization-related competence protein ComEC/Rec2 n=2 Tax=Thiohalocapsa marina TaxID=424902 RepID=A0A5M8FJ99_9GAMM|nr:DNA internalization-related competence protein ComEC/Rec2 [Thiohalocapsa marina]